MTETPTPDEIALDVRYAMNLAHSMTQLPHDQAVKLANEIKRLLALVAAQAEQNAELRGGEDDTPVPDGVQRTPGQWLAKLHTVGVDERLHAIAAVLESSHEGWRCWEQDHPATIRMWRERAERAEAELSALRATDEYQRWARAVTERDAAREAVSELRARVEAEIESWHHTVVDDCWYTCPAATEEREGETCCDDDRRGAACDCGLDLRKAKIRAALEGGAAT